MRDRGVHRDTDFIQGNIACAEGAIAAGCRFFAGYPITPATEIAEYMSKRLFSVGGTFIQTEDEIAAIASVIGASWGGAKAMTATSGPGISLMQENIGFAVATETPCVLVNVQRGAPSTGSPSVPLQGDMLQPRFGSHGEYQIVAIAPATVQEMFEHTVWAFNKAERYRTPVFVLADGMIGHMRAEVPLAVKEELTLENRKVLAHYEGVHQRIFLDEEVAPMPVFGRGLKANVTGSCHREDGFRNVSDPEVLDHLIKILRAKILKHREDLVVIEEDHMEDARVALFSYGLTSRAALEAVRLAREEGIPAGSVRAVTVWPFADEEVTELASRVEAIIVCENNLGQVVHFVRSAVEGRCLVEFLPPRVLGTLHDPQTILAEIREVLS
jgi:2-oxoglutarate ferredoxin oxidoreductase subunit alpha